MDESVDFIKREEFKLGSPGIPLTEEQVQAIVDSYNDYKKQKGALPNIINVIDNFTAKQKKILGKSGNPYRVKKILEEKKLKLSLKPSAEKRKAADIVRVKKLKEERNPFLTDKKLEEKFIKDLEKRFSYPLNSAAAKEAGVLSDKEMMKKYNFGNRKLTRYIADYKDKLNLSYPKQTFEGEKLLLKTRLEKRKDLQKEVSGLREEQKILDIKRPLDTGRKSYKGIDLAHKASLEQFKDLGLKYGVTNLGLDKTKINQSIIRPTEEKMESLHKKRMELIKNVKPGKVPKDIQKKLEQINIKMSNLSMGSKGTLQAVLIDEKTLKPFVFNKDYSRIIGQGLIDKPVKELTKAELDLIRIQMPELMKTTKKKLNLDLDKKSKIVKIPTAMNELLKRVGSGVDPALAARAVKEQFVDPLTSRVPTGKGIRALSTAGRIALPEAYFAPLSIGLDVYAGRTPKEMALNVATLGTGAPIRDAFKKAQALKEMGLLDDYKRALAKANRADQALAEEVETLGMDTPAEEFAKPEFTVGEQIAAIAGLEEDLKLDKRLKQKAAEYQKLREDQLKKGLLEVTPEGEELPEDVGIKPEILPVEAEDEEESLGFLTELQVRSQEI